MQRGGVICLKYIMKGHFSAIKPDVGLGMFNGRLVEVFDIINNASFMHHIDSNSGLELIDVRIMNNAFTLIHP